MLTELLEKVLHAGGDELEIEITGLKKKFARGKILNISKASALRVKPLCQYYENCGGCCYQHIIYEQQLEIKKRQVEDVFQKIGKIANVSMARRYKLEEEGRGLQKARLINRADQR